MEPVAEAPAARVYSKYPCGPGCTGKISGAAGALGLELPQAGVPIETSAVAHSSAHKRVVWIISDMRWNGALDPTKKLRKRECLPEGAVRLCAQPFLISI